MSSTIFYHETIFRIPGSHAGIMEDLFIHACQAGPSNCYESGRNGRDGRRTREWQVNAFGTEKEVLTAGIRVAGDLEGGGLKLGNTSQWSKPESYIRRVRRLLKDARSGADIFEHCHYRGFQMSFSAFVYEDLIGSKPGKTEYDWRDQEQFSTFYDRYKAKKGELGMAYNFFTAHGPEMR